MKTIQIILLILIVIGLGLIFTQKMWLPAVTSYIVPAPAMPEPIDMPQTPQPPQVAVTDMDTWNWVFASVSQQGTVFLYPKPLPTQYVAAEIWPPQVTMTADDFVCEEGAVDTATVVRRTINENVYCVTTSSEGAAGSVYTTYEYKTAQGDFVTSVAFTLRTPQCLNYDEPNQSVCKTEQANFDSDALADRIASSLRMQ